MSLTYAHLKTKPKKLLAFTGLRQVEFETLLVAFREVSQPAEQMRPRQRQPGGGRKATLKLAEDQLVFILFYLKTYPLQEVMSELFGLDTSNVNEWIHRLLPLVLAALDRLGVLPERAPEAVAQAQTEQPAGKDVIIDGTERRRQRPKNPEKQALHYSGKKKTHTDKNVLLAERQTGRVWYLSQTYPGIAHDKKIADHEQLRYTPQTQLHQDSGFQGYQPAGVVVHQPQKSRAGGRSRVKPSATIET